MKFVNKCFFVFLIIFFGIFLIGGVGATVTWDGMDSGINLGNSSENDTSPFTYNFSSNISFAAGDLPLRYIFGENSNISSSVYGTKPYSFFSGWISINSTTGIFSINSTTDNRSGGYNATIDVYNSLNTQSAGARTFYFIINATNDAPSFTNNQSLYSIGENAGFYLFNISGGDEESHYPLVFNITNFTGCSLADWSTRGAENCTLPFGIINYTNTTSGINFTSISHNDVGVYNLTICMNETVLSAPAYAVSDYLTNHSVCFNTTLSINSILTVVSNCSEKNWVEGDTLYCEVNITTKGENDNLKFWSNASLRNYNLNSAYPNYWLYGMNNTNASNFFLNVPITLVLNKSQVGNWSINFTVNDTSSGEAVNISIFYIYVNWSGTNSLPVMTSIANIDNLSVNYLKEIYFNVSDNDIIVPDKNVRNESFSYAYVVLNQTDLSVLANFSDFSFSALGDTAGTNITRMKILFTPNSSEAGNYTLNVTATDSFGEITFQVFNISIFSNTAPQWNSSVDYVFNLNTSMVAHDENFRFTLNLTNSSGLAYAYDSDLNEITFTNGSAFTNFDLSNGVINFTPWKQDVGYWNVSITATDALGLTNTTYFIFNISNNNTSPKVISLTGAGDDDFPIANASSIAWAEDSVLDFELTINDSDLSVVNKSAYNESLSIDMVVTNLSSGNAVSDFFVFAFNSASGDNQTFLGSFIPTSSQIGNYSVVISVTDNSSAVGYWNFNVNITSTDDAPELSAISNQVKTVEEILYLDINATDEEDGSDSSGNLVFAIYNLTSGGNFINSSNFNFTTGVINLTNLSDYAGLWRFNATVNDSVDSMDSQEFNITIYGYPNLISPSNNSVFNFTENTAGNFSFAVNHSVGNNLTYELWMNNITCSYQNNSDCNYTNMSLIQSFNNSGTGSLFNRSFTPSYWDETYGNYKNLTLRVYPATSELNSTQKNLIAQNFSFYLNISHTNSPPEIYLAFGSHSGTYGTSTPININLSQNIRDIDYSDTYYSQNLTFNITSSSALSNIMSEAYSVSNGLPWSGEISDLYLQLYALTATEEYITISVNDSYSSDSSDAFTVTFTAPSTTVVATPSPSSGGGGSNSIKHYSLRIIVPADIVVSENNFISVPFSVQNNGEIDLAGINLSTMIFYENLFSDAVRISLDDAYIDKLGFGQSKNFTMTIYANTHVAGKYKATVYADIKSPKFSDWAEFYIELRKINESEAEQMLLFTEKLLAENARCIELTELLNDAKKLFSEADYDGSFQKSSEAIHACENAISSNEQIGYRKGAEQDLFTYLGYSTLLVFGFGFIFYIYKRVRFNKSKIND